MFSLLPGIGIAVMQWQSGVVADRTFTLGGLDVCTCLFAIHCHVCLYSCVNFPWLVSTTKFFLTAKFSRPTVCGKLLYKLNRKPNHIIIFICTAFWFKFCKVNADLSGIITVDVQGT